MKRNSTLSIVIASICILVYLAALVWGLVRVYSSFDERRNLAFKEFYQLVDIAGSAGVLGFMDEPFVKTIEDSLAGTRTIEALIISGPDDSYAFEKVRGKSINWVNNLPRFKNRFDFMRQPFYEPLRSLNLRNASIEAKAGALDYELVADVLKQTLVIIAAALLLAFFTLLCEVLLDKQPTKVRAKDEVEPVASPEPAAVPTPEAETKPTAPPAAPVPQAADEPVNGPHNSSEVVADPDLDPELQKIASIELETADDSVAAAPLPAAPVAAEPVKNEPPAQDPQKQVTVKKNAETIEETVAEADEPIPGDAAVAAALAVAAQAEAGDTPRGLYTPRGNIGWEEYTSDRLESELQRCASNEQDLVIIDFDFKDSSFIDDSFFRHFADDVVAFFTLRDLVFERGERGIAVICPNVDLDTAFAKANEFHDRCHKKFEETIQEQTLCIGMSSRAGRLIDAERLIFEASEALAKALADPESHIVAFKSDPEKYRAFIANQNH